MTLPEMTLKALREYWKTHRHPKFLFPRGRTHEERHNATEPMDRGGLQKSFKVIVQDVDITLRTTARDGGSADHAGAIFGRPPGMAEVPIMQEQFSASLRHCYGTLLTDMGVGLRAIQEQMSHERPKTTALYTQLSQYHQQDTDKRINGMMSKLRVNWGD